MECDQYFYRTGNRYGSIERMRQIGLHGYDTGSNTHKGDRKRNYTYNFNTDTSYDCPCKYTNNDAHDYTNNGTYDHPHNGAHDYTIDYTNN